MAEEVKWGSVSQGSGNAGFLKLDKGTYKIRPVFGLVKFYKYFHKDPQGKMRVATVKSNMNRPEMDRHPELKKPSLRYASIVLDRLDDSKVKIVEAPQSVYSPMGDRYDATKVDPGGIDTGGDWQIKVTGDGLNRRYSDVYINDTPLTKDEKRSIAEFLGKNDEGKVNKSKLIEMYKFDTDEEVEEKLFGEYRKNDSNNSSENNNSDSNTVEDNSTSDSGSDDDFDF